MVQTPVLAPDIKDKVLHYAKILHDHHIPVEKLIVFGSQTSGRVHPGSDIDICVVSKIFGKNRFDEGVMLSRLTDNYTTDIEPHPYHPNDLNLKYDILAAEIRKHGIQI